MYLLSRTSIVGRNHDNPHVFSQGHEHDMMTFSLSTDPRMHHLPFSQRHKILVAGSKMIQYARDFLTPGKLVFAEGRLEYIKMEQEDCYEAWIIISPDNGILHPLGCSKFVSDGAS